MIGTVVRCELAAGALLLSAGVASAAGLVPPYGPQTADQSRSEALAQATPVGDACARAASAERHDKWLHVTRGVSLTYRYDAIVRLDEARLAALQGNDPRCWSRLGLAEELNEP